MDGFSLAPIHRVAVAVALLAAVVTSPIHPSRLGASSPNRLRRNFAVPTSHHSSARLAAKALAYSPLRIKALPTESNGSTEIVVSALDSCGTSPPFAGKSRPESGPPGGPLVVRHLRC